MKKFLCIVALFLSACNSLDSQLPYQPGSMPDLPTGSPEFTQGWKDGCESGFSAYGNDLYKTLYHFKRTAEFEKNDVYTKAWKDSYNYCRQYANSWARPITSPENLVPMDTYDNKDPVFDANSKTTDNFLSLPTAGGFLSLPTADSFFGGGE